MSRVSKESRQAKKGAAKTAEKSFVNASTHDPTNCQEQIRCQMIDVDRENRVHCCGLTLEALKLQGAVDLMFEKNDVESVKKLQIVCEEDGREMNSTEQLREHLSMGHKNMLLLKEDNELTHMALAVNVDKISPLITKLTTGDLEENLLAWAKDKQLSHYLEAITYSSPDLVAEGCNKSSVPLMDIQTRIGKLINPEFFEGDSEDDDFYMENFLDTSSGSENLNRSDVDSEGDRKSSELSSGSSSA